MPMTRNFPRTAFAVLAAVAAVAACNRGEKAGASGPTVALVVKTLNNAFFIEMEKGAKAAADSLGIQLVVQAPEREIDVEKQMQIVENLIERKVDVLLLVPSGSRRCPRDREGERREHSGGECRRGSRAA